MNLTNYKEHPADTRYYVFTYYVTQYADEFEELLNEKEIGFERHFDEEDGVILFGIKKTFLKEALWCNSIVHGRHRKPMIPNSVVRWTLLLVTGGAIILAILGYLKQG